MIYCLSILKTTFGDLKIAGTKHNVFVIELVFVCVCAKQMKLRCLLWLFLLLMELNQIVLMSRFFARAASCFTWAAAWCLWTGYAAPVCQSHKQLWHLYSSHGDSTAAVSEAELAQQHCIQLIHLVSMNDTGVYIGCVSTSNRQEQKMGAAKSCRALKKETSAHLIHAFV